MTVSRAVTNATVVLLLGAIAIAVGGPTAMERSLFFVPVDLAAPTTVGVIVVALSVLVVGLAESRRGRNAPKS